MISIIINHVNAGNTIPLPAPCYTRFVHEYLIGIEEKRGLKVFTRTHAFYNVFLIDLRAMNTRRREWEEINDDH